MSSFALTPCPIESKHTSYAKAFSILLLLSFIITGCLHSIHAARNRYALRAEPVVENSGNNSTGSVAKSVSQPCKQINGGRQFDCTDEETKQALYNQAKNTIWKQDKVTKTQKVTKATVTGYSSRAQETDSTPEIAANGQNIWKLYQQGSNTCASNDYKIGTVLTLKGLGTCVVRDRMNKRYTGTGRIDWYFGYDTKAAYAHGIKTIEVII